MSTNGQTHCKNLAEFAARFLTSSLPFCGHAGLLYVYLILVYYVHSNVYLMF